MNERTLKALCVFGLLIIVIGVILTVYSETEEKTVSVVPVPKRERITTYPYQIPGGGIAIVGGIVSATSFYYLSKKRAK